MAVLLGPFASVLSPMAVAASFEATASLPIAVL
jgi:hypothetical protein